MPVIIVTGVEHSGTGAVAAIVRTGIPDALHRAIPHVWPNGREDWSAHWYVDARYVVVTREPEIRDLSTVSRGVTAEDAVKRRQRAERLLAHLPGPVYWQSIEHLVADPDDALGHLGRFLGVELTLPEPLYDLNARWRGQG